MCGKCSAGPAAREGASGWGREANPHEAVVLGLALNDGYKLVLQGKEKGLKETYK